MIIDKSGSMQPLTKDVIGGYNAYLDGLTEEGEDYRITSTFFDTNFIILHKDKPVKDAERLDEDSYKPSGFTAMYDAIGVTLTELPDFPKEDKVIVVIQTDGQENSSREYGTGQVKRLITSKTESGWLFMYLGVGPDVWENSSMIGISRSQTFATAPTSAGTKSSFRGVTASTLSYHATGDAAVSATAYAATPGAVDPQWQPPAESDTIKKPTSKPRGSKTPKS
jgi:hypothetical protein